MDVFFLQSTTDESEEEEEEEEEKPPKDTKKVDDSKTQSLQNALLEYLVYNSQNDPALIVSVICRNCANN